MYNDSINVNYVENQLKMVLSVSGYPYEINSITITEPDPNINYVRTGVSCQFTANVDLTFDGRSCKFNLFYPYEVESMFVFNRKGFDARPKVGICIGVTHPVIIRHQSGTYFPLEGIYYSKSEDNFKFQGNKISWLEMELALQTKELNPLTMLRAESINKGPFKSSIDAIKFLIETPDTHFEELNSLDIDLMDPSSGLTDFIKRNRFRICNRIRSRYDNKSQLSFTPLQSYIYRFFQVNSSDQLQSPSITNPISLQSNCRKLYIKSYSNSGKESSEIRLKYNQSLFGLICPIKTIDSAKVNIKNEISSCLEFLDGKPFVQVYNKNLEVIHLNYLDFFRSRVICSDSWDYEHNKIMPNPTYSFYGNLIRGDQDMEWDYLHLENGEFSVGISCIPMVNSTDSSRSALGAHMLDQALPVESGEEQIVYSKGFIKPITSASDVTGTITKITQKEIQVTSTGPDGKEEVKYQPFPERKYSSFHSQCRYQTSKKVGDSVVKGDPLFELQGASDKIKVGVNVNIAYMHVGADYEDGIILRRGILPKFAHKMVTEIKEEYLNWEADEISNDFYDHGLIKVGSIVTEGMSLIIGKSKVNSKGKLAKIMKVQSALIDINVPYSIIHKGRVVDIKIISNSDNLPLAWTKYKSYSDEPEVTRFVITIEYDNLPKEGDKFTTLHGSKGVITKIIEDEDMYRMEDGTLIDGIISPTSTIGRKGLSQLKIGFLSTASRTLWTRNDLQLSSGSTEFQKMKDELAILTMNPNYSSISDEEFLELHKTSSTLRAYQIRSKTMDTRFTYPVLKGIADSLGMDIDCKHKLHNHLFEVETPIVVNLQYLTRLHFIVEDKSTASSEANHPSFQLRGVTNRSEGQKFGEQELFAFMAQGMNPAELVPVARDNMGEELVLQLLLIGQGIENLG